MGEEERSLGVGMVIDGYTLLILARTTLLMIAYASCYAIDLRVATPAFSIIDSTFA